MTNELMKQDNTQLAKSAAPAQQEQILKGDIVLPKVLLMQGSSTFVKKERVRAPGDICRSTNRELLGSDKSPIEFIPLTFQNLWMLSEDEKGKGNKDDYKFRGYEERNARNETMEWDYMQNGTHWKRTKVMNLYALLPKDIDAMTAAMEKFKATGEMPDLDAALLPVVIPFKNSSFRAAKDISTLFVKAADLAMQMGVEVPVYGRTMKLEATEENKDEHDYFALKVTPAGQTKKEYLTQANRWRTTLMQMGNSVKVDESDVAADVMKETEEAFNNRF